MISFSATAVYLILAIGLLAGSWLKPPVGLAAVVCMITLKQLGLASHAVFYDYPLATNILVAIAVSLALLRQLISGKHYRAGPPHAYWLIICLYAFALLSCRWTRAPDDALDQWTRIGPYIVLMLATSPWLARTPKEVETALVALFAAGMILICGLLYSADWGARGIILNDDPLQETNPLAIGDLAGYVAISLVFLGQGPLSRLPMLARLALTAVCTYAIVRSGSRGQLLAFLVTLIVIYPMAFPLYRLKATVPLIMAILVIGATIFLAIGDSVSWYDGYSDYIGRWGNDVAVLADAQGRWSMSQDLYREWSNGNVLVFLFGLGNSASFSTDIVGTYPHNAPVEVLAEEGIFGAGLYIAILLLTLRSILAARKATPIASRARATIATLAALTFFAFQVSLKQGSLIGSTSFFAFAVLASSFASAFVASRARAGRALANAAR